MQTPLLLAGRHAGSVPQRDRKDADRVPVLAKLWLAEGAFRRCVLSARLLTSTWQVERHNKPEVSCRFFSSSCPRVARLWVAGLGLLSLHRWRRVVSVSFLTLCPQVEMQGDKVRVVRATVLVACCSGRRSVVGAAVDASRHFGNLHMSHNNKCVPKLTSAHSATRRTRRLRASTPSRSVSRLRLPSTVYVVFFVGLCACLCTTETCSRCE
jgi:hypothetical protein